MKIKTQKQFETFIHRLCKKNDIDIRTWRYIIHLDKAPKALPNKTNKGKSSTALYFTFNDIHIMFMNNIYGQAQWLGDATIMHEYYNPKVKMGSRKHDYYTWTKLNQEMKPGMNGFDLEMEHIKDFCKKWNVQYNSERGVFSVEEPETDKA